jgi:gamma-glutamyl-gamma-aminobutyrate hydrolase PuuD
MDGTERSVNLQEDGMSRPIIGITSELDAARWGNWIREAVVSPVSYARAVERCGGAPVLLPPVPPESLTALIAVVGGLVFTGGRDIDPLLYSQQRHDETDLPERRRDRFEFALMRAAIEAGVPFLAIGRGLHVLTVARGGALTQHLPAHRTDRAKYLPHDVALSTASRLGKLLGAKIQAPAAHHQAPSRVGAGLTIAGWSPDDDVVEALEVDGHPFGIAVQWHPEEGDDPRLITALVEAASQPRQDRPREPEPEPRDLRPGEPRPRPQQPPGSKKQAKAARQRTVARG